MYSLTKNVCNIQVKKSLHKSCQHFWSGCKHSEGWKCLSAICSHHNKVPSRAKVIVHSSWFKVLDNIMNIRFLLIISFLEEINSISIFLHSEFYPIFQLEFSAKINITNVLTRIWVLNVWTVPLGYAVTLSLKNERISCLFFLDFNVPKHIKNIHIWNVHDRASKSLLYKWNALEPTVK